LFDNNRLVIVPGDALLVKEKVGDKTLTNVYGVPGGDPMATISHAASDQDKQRVVESNPDFKAVAGRPGIEVDTMRPRVTSRSWMGPSYLIVLLLVIIITNVPLRGLWSLVVLIGLVMVALIISLAGWWDDILNAFVGLHVFINLAGYLLLAAVLFLIWLVSVFFFDRRSYIIFTPGQIRVCEEIGNRERTYDTTGMTIEKQRDDWFRHIFLGFGTGDLIVRTAGADRHEILMPNVAMIGFKIDPIQQLIRQRQTEAMPPHAA
jgi:hypothetical protein